MILLVCSPFPSYSSSTCHCTKDASKHIPASSSPHLFMDLLPWNLSAFAFFKLAATVGLHSLQ